MNRIALINKDLFADLLRFGKVILPDYSYSVVSKELPIEEALKIILKLGNPIEYPSQYIIVAYDCSDNTNELPISTVKELIATDADGKRLFSSQFRDDLIIQPERYESIFQEYLESSFQKEKITKGIVAFRTLCGLNVADNYDEEVSVIYRGLSNRIRFRHHFQLPAEERNEPYSLMISYDRHAPYPKGWIGYFYDLIETFCYHSNPNLGYSDMVINGTSIYKQISALQQSSKLKQIEDAIKDEKFTQLCNKFFYRPGGYMAPYIFFVLRDGFRDTESFFKHASLIENLKIQYPDAFDSASIFIGGFFGFEKFYDDYYTALNLPIFGRKPPFRAAESVPAAADETPKKVDLTYADNPVISGPKEDAKDEIVESTSQNSSYSNDSLNGIFLAGTDLFKNMYYIIDSCLKPGKYRDSILAGLSKYKDDDTVLEIIRELLVSQKENQKLIKTYLTLSRYQVKEFNDIRDSFRLSENK